MGIFRFWKNRKLSFSNKSSNPLLFLIIRNFAFRLVHIPRTGLKICLSLRSWQTEFMPNVNSFFLSFLSYFFLQQSIAKPFEALHILTANIISKLTIKLTVTYDNFVAILTKLVLSRPRGSSDTFLLGNSLGISPKVPFAIKMMTAVSPYIA